MMKSTMSMVKGIMTGMVIGGTLSAIAVGTMKPNKKRMVKKKTAHAIDTVSAIMQNIADCTR